jgi:hypothetical protein
MKKGTTPPASNIEASNIEVGAQFCTANTKRLK